MDSKTNGIRKTIVRICVLKNFVILTIIIKIEGNFKKNEKKNNYIFLTSYSGKIII